MSDSGVKTDEKKQHFDDIYVAETPVPFKERILDELKYVSDNFNRQTFDRLILPWAEKKAASGALNVVDLAGCFGNTTMATINGMDYDSIRENWKDTDACRAVAQPRRFSANITGIDISANALAYGKSAGIYDDIIQADLNTPEAALEAHRIDRFGEISEGTYDPVRGGAEEMGVEIGTLDPESESEDDNTTNSTSETNESTTNASTSTNESDT